MTRCTFMIAFFVLGASTASAQDANALFDQGVEHLRRGSYAHAANAFHRSYSLEPRVAAMCNLALTYDQWGHHESDAISAYERCAEEDTSGRYRQHALERAHVLRQQGRPTADPFAAPEVERRPPETQSRDGHPYLVTGLVLGAGAIATLVPGILKNRSASRDEAYLHETYSDGRIPAQLPSGTTNPDVQRLSDAQRNANIGRGLYIASGALAGLALVFVFVDVGARVVESPSFFTAGPIEGGGMMNASFQF